MLVNLDDFRTLLQYNTELRRGCILDTNVVFAATYPLDTHNEWAEEILKELQRLRVITYTNINVRSEFIELSRRVLIPECLMDLYRQLSSELPEKVNLALRSLKTRMDSALKDDRAFKISDQEIKRFRSLINLYQPPNTLSGWEFFCLAYLLPYMRSAWPSVVENLQLEFLGTRAIESLEHFHDKPSWTEMVEIVGKFGIGAADAMIINLFLKSKFPLIVTTDSDVRDAVTKLGGEDKYVLAI